MYSSPPCHYLQFQTSCASHHASSYQYYFVVSKTIKKDQWIDNLHPTESDHPCRTEKHAVAINALRLLRGTSQTTSGTSSNCISVSIFDEGISSSYFCLRMPGRKVLRQQVSQGVQSHRLCCHSAFCWGSMMRQIFCRETLTSISQKGSSGGT